MNDIIFIMPLRNRSERAINSIKSIAESQYGKYFDILIVQDSDIDNLTFDNFDLNIFNKRSIGKIEIIDVKLGGVFNKTLLMNHGIKRTNHKYIIQQDADILYANDFLYMILDICRNPQNLQNHLFITPYIESDDMKGREFLCSAPPRKRGDLVSYTLLLERNQIEGVRGYDERMKIWQEENDLIIRLKKKYNLLPYDLGKVYNICNLHVTHENNIRSHIELDSVNRCLYNQNIANNTLVVNDKEWGEIVNYETNI